MVGKDSGLVILNQVKAQASSNREEIGRLMEKLTALETCMSRLCALEVNMKDKDNALDVRLQVMEGVLVTSAAASSRWLSVRRVYDCVLRWGPVVCLAAMLLAKYRGPIQTVLTWKLQTLLVSLRKLQVAMS
jgi:hypothetical protein